MHRLGKQSGAEANDLNEFGHRTESKLMQNDLNESKANDLNEFVTALCVFSIVFSPFGVFSNLKNFPGALPLDPANDIRFASLAGSPSAKPIVF